MSLTTTEQSEKQKKMLYTLLEHARKSGKPVILSRLTSDSAGGAENVPTFSSTANKELLQSLRLRRSSLEKVELPSIIDATKPSLVTGTVDLESSAGGLLQPGEASLPISRSLYLEDWIQSRSIL